MKKKIYIAGKVTGLPPQEVIEKFKEASEAVKAIGFEVVNPIEVVNDINADWKGAMIKCITALVQCDAIVLLPDWSKSKGAIIEYDLSKSLEMPNFRGTTFGIQKLKEHKWNS